MGVVIPQVVSEDRASGAQIVDGGLRFDKTKLNYLSWTPSSSGNRNNWTISCWMKRGKLDANQRIFENSSNNFFIRFGADVLQWNDGPSGSNGENTPADTLRDTSGWYHLVFSWDSSLGVLGNAIYINGRLTQYVQTGGGNPSTSSGWNVGSALHTIGRNASNTSRYYDGQLSNVYFIDGQALGPEYFGYTDPLTNVWRPKKFSAFNNPNNGTTWSSSVTEESDAGYYSGYEASKGFDGNLSTLPNTQANNNNGNITFTPATPITYTSSVRAYWAAATTATYSFNGGANENLTSSQGWVDIASGSGTFTSLNTFRTGDGVFFAAIEIDGYVLIDGTVDNSFHLPLDGSAPIGQDQSGRGNNWTPVNFGGSNTIEKATGALPILNTDGGGKVARPGVLGSEVSKNYTLTGSSGAGNGYVFSAEGTKPTLSFHRGGTYTFDYTSATSHPLYLSSLNDGKHNAKAYSVSFDGSGDYLTVASGSDYDFGTGDFTVEWYQYWNNAPGTYESPFGINYATNPNFLVQSGNGTTAYTIYMNGTSTTITESIAGPTGEWVHYAIVRSGSDTNNIKIYRNGVVTGQGTYTGNVGNGSVAPTIAHDGTYYFDGKISNFRIVKGTAVYTSEFNPPATTLTDISGTVLLCCQDNSAGTAEVGTISSVSGNAVASNTSPFLYDTDNYFGVDTSTSNVTKMTVPHWAADTLYYYCNVHAGMGNSVSVVTDIKKADIYAWKNVLALPLVGIKSDFSNAINSGTSNKTITVTNAVTSVDSNFYGGSYYFDGSGDYLTIPATSDLNFGTGDFTIEAWVKVTIPLGNFRQTLCGQTDNVAGRYGVRLDNDGSGTFGFTYDSSGSGYRDLVSGLKVTSGVWSHIAVVRQNGIFKFFVNGIKGTDNSSYTSESVGNNSSAFYVARNAWDGSTYDAVQYVQDLRVYKGISKYTSNFIPASTDPDIVPDSPSGVSYSSNVTQITDGAVSFDGTNDSLSIPDSADFTFGSGDFTMEAFVYCNNASTAAHKSIVMKYTTDNASSSWFWSVYNGGQYLYFYYGSSVVTIYSSSFPQSAWVHCAIVRDGNTLRMFQDGIQVATGDVTGLTNNDSSVALTIGEDGQNNYDMNGFISNVRVVKGTALYTSNFTPPTRTLTATENTKLLCCKSNSLVTAYDVSPTSSADSDLNVDFTSSPISDVSGNAVSITPANSPSIVSAGDNSYGLTNAVELNGTNQHLVIGNIGWNSNRDFTIEGFFFIDDVGGSAGYFFDMRSATYTSAPYIYYDLGNPSGGTFNLNTPQGAVSAAGPVGVWIHIRMTNAAVYVNGNQVIAGPGQKSISTSVIGARYSADSTWFNGKIAGFRAVDTNLGAPTSAQIQTTSGVLINTIDASIISNGNTAATNFNPFTVDIDTVRGKQSGYATWNPLKMGTSDVSMSEGNLFWRTTSNGPDRITVSTIGMTRGKYYWENEVVEATATGIGIANEFANQNSSPASTHCWIYYSATGQAYLDGSASTYGAAYTTNGTIIGVAFDRDNLTLEFYKDGVSQGKLTNISGLTDSETYFAMCGDSGGASQSQVRGNFGQKPFKFPPPPGFQPLTLANLQRPSIVRPDQYVGVTTYTGNNGTQNIITGFKPDLLWFKSRTTTAVHAVIDSVRGRASGLITNNTDGESTSPAENDVVSFDSNGFTLGPVSQYNSINQNGTSIVAWAWKAGGNSNTFNIDDVGYDTAEAAGLTDGTITPTGASVNTKSGFSIITHSGSGSTGTISHGLGKAPAFIITKIRNSEVTSSWQVYHQSLGATKYITLDETAAAQTSSTRWNDTAPTSSLISLGSNTASSYNWVMYAWAEIPGFSKFGSYTGNGSAAGPVIITGFRPRWILIKRYDSGSTASWHLYDSERAKYNVITTTLAANESSGEGSFTSGYDLDFLSNGVKIRAASSNAINTTSATYIYAAFAEAPTFNLYGAQANAR